MKTIISPSMLSCDFANIQRDVEMINASSADWFHIDVMDGVFVPNISFGFPVLSAMKKHATKPMDVHIMIENPDAYIQDFKNAGADILTVHFEACRHLHRTIQAIKAVGMKAGVALNPHTPVSLLSDVIADLDLVLIMSVNPGFGGQKFIDHAVEKVKQTKELIASMAQMKDGVATINIKDQKTGEVVLKQVDQLTPEDIEKLKQSQEEQGKSVEQLAVDQLDELKQINSGINGVGAAATYGRATSAPLERLYESMMGAQKAISKTAAERITGKEVRANVSAITQPAEDYLISGLKGDVSGMKKAQEDLGVNLVKLEKKLETTSQETLMVAAQRMGESFQKAYEKPTEMTYKGELNINGTVDVKGNENTKNISKEDWNNIWIQYLNEPQWKEASGIVFKEANPVSIAVGPKTP